MKRIILACSLVIGFVAMSFAQTYFTRDGKISFYSSAPLEEIEAHNSTATSVVDLASGKMEFAILIKAFQFKKALMQEHFNENYMESNKFPKSTFKGQIENYSKIAVDKDGEYPVTVKGKITIHGQTKDIESKGKIFVKGGKVSAKSEFELTVADYGIEIPGIVRDKIAKTVKVVLNMDYQEYKDNSN